jgi:hypothetical protein
VDRETAGVSESVSIELGANPPATSPAAEETSAPYVGRWNRLVSTTNWEKGRIIHDWRQALELAGSSVHEYGDDAWARRVGGVSGQHVGRLRRVHARFGDAAGSYAGLFWSHFQAALDWDDAEMWLEGAVQSEWSVAAMRRSRAEARGEPAPLEIPSSVEFDEDAAAPAAAPRRTETDFGAESEHGSGDRSAEFAGASEAGDDDEPAREPGDYIEPDLHGGAAPWEEDAPVSAPGPFAALGELPADMAEAVEAMKLAILRHKLAGWEDLRRADVLAALDALRSLVEAT